MYSPQIFGLMKYARQFCTLCASVFIGILLVIGGGPAPAQAQAPESDVRTLLSDLETADQLSERELDERLIEKATALLKAREQRTISLAEYARRVDAFRAQYPAFYGAFFGDPEFAVFNARYHWLATQRRAINLEINPHKSIFNVDWFFCHPYSYDMAFGGVCRGFGFSASDFLVLPSYAVFKAPQPGSKNARSRLLSGLMDERNIDDHRSSAAWSERTTSTGDTPAEAYDRPEEPVTVDAGHPTDEAEIGSPRPIDLSDLKPVPVPPRAVARYAQRHDETRPILRTGDHRGHRGHVGTRSGRRIDHDDYRQRRRSSNPSSEETTIQRRPTTPDRGTSGESSGGTSQGGSGGPDRENSGGNEHE